MFTVTTFATTVVVLLLYRPGGVAVRDTFFIELILYLEVQAMYKFQLLIAGDFNIHVEATNNHDALKLVDIFASFDGVQHVPLQPTHRGGGIHDLVITKG